MVAEMTRLTIDEFMDLTPHDQIGALMVYYPYKEGTDGPAHWLEVCVAGRLLPDQPPAAAYDCEDCGEETETAYYADRDSHNPHFCPSCFRAMNETSEFYLGDPLELTEKVEELEAGQ